MAITPAFITRQCEKCVHYHTVRWSGKVIATCSFTKDNAVLKSNQRRRELKEENVFELEKCPDPERSNEE